jgi:4-amino-4-deoxy-L-arabinose transferase-like glycosyltransferase
VLLALALILVSYGAFRRDLWTDEAFSASYAAHPSIGAVLEDVRKNEETPPVYFVVIWAWARLAGQGELALRGLSLLFGLLAVAAFAEIARRRLAPAEALLAGLVFAAAPLLARYFVEVRGYTLMLLLTLACIAAFERLYRDPARPIAFAAYTLAAAGLFLTSYFGSALIVAHNLIWLALLLRRPAQWQRLLLWWCAAQIGIALIALPWLPSLLYQLKVAPAVSPFQNAQPQHYLWLLLMPLMATPPGTLWALLWLLPTAICWGLVGLALARSEGVERGLVLRTFVVPALTLLALIVWMQAIGPRYLMTLVPGLVLGAAAGWGALRARAPQLAPLVAGLLLGGIVVYRLAGAVLPGGGKPWTALTPTVARQANIAGDAVLFHPPMEERTFSYYYEGPALALLGARDYDDFYYAEGHDLFAAWTRDDALAATRGYRRIWLFYNPALGTQRLDLPYPAVGRWRSEQLELTLYEVPVK